MPSLEQVQNALNPQGNAGGPKVMRMEKRGTADAFLIDAGVEAPGTVFWIEVPQANTATQHAASARSEMNRRRRG